VNTPTVLSISWLRLRRTLFLLVLPIYARLRNAQRTEGIREGRSVSPDFDVPSNATSCLMPEGAAWTYEIKLDWNRLEVVRSSHLAE
jgi:hypothetical protein